MLTGINRRPDSSEFKKTTFGIIPLGATNANWNQFSGKVLGSWTSPYTRAMRIVESAQMILNKNSKKVDLLALTNEDEKTVSIY